MSNLKTRIGKLTVFMAISEQNSKIFSEGQIIWR